MTAIVTLVFIGLFSFLAIKVATIALMMTGLSYDTASFQSYSAFFGVGFTTREAGDVLVIYGKEEHTKRLMQSVPALG